MARTSAADLAHSLKGADFPMDREQLAELARDNGAPEEVLRTIEELPEGEYGSLADVERGFGESSHRRGREDTSEASTEMARKGGHGSRSGERFR